MKRENAIARINNAVENSNYFHKSQKAYKLIINALRGYEVIFGYRLKRDLTIRPVYTSGTGRYTHNEDHTSAVRAYLDAARIKYEFGNDAARGGLCGNYFKLTL